MTKITISFKDEDENTIRHHLNGPLYKETFNEVWQQVFRPAMKHGYNDKKINNILNKINDAFQRLSDELGEDFESGVGEDLIYEIGNRYIEVLSNNDISLE